MSLCLPSTMSLIFVCPHCCHFISVSPFVAVLHLCLPSLRGCYFSLQRRQRTDPVHPRRVKRRLQMRLYESKISFFFNHSTKRISYFGQIVTQTGWSWDNFYDSDKRTAGWTLFFIPNANVADAWTVRFVLRAVPKVSFLLLGGRFV